MSKHDKAQDKTNAMRMFDAVGLPHEDFVFTTPKLRFRARKLLRLWVRIPIRCSKRS